MQHGRQTFPATSGSLPVSSGSLPVTSESLPVTPVSLLVTLGSLPVTLGSLPVTSGSLPVSVASCVAVARSHGTGIQAKKHPSVRFATSVGHAPCVYAIRLPDVDATHRMRTATSKQTCTFDAARTRGVVRCGNRLIRG